MNKKYTGVPFFFFFKKNLYLVSFHCENSFMKSTESTVALAVAAHDLSVIQMNISHR